MRFGIMAMQLESLLPMTSSTELDIAKLAQFDHANLVRKIAQSGFKLIELGGDLYVFLNHTFSPQAIERLGQLKAELDLNFTVHLPLWSVEPSTPLTQVRRGSIQAVTEIIQATLQLQPETYVLNATGSLAAEFYRMKIPDASRMMLLRIFYSNARESIKQILSETGIPSRLLAIETIEFPFEHTLELANELDLSICLDTGHILVGFSGPIDILHALELCLPRLGEVHLHDGVWQGLEMKIGYGLDHQKLGAGDLNVRDFLDRLILADWNGPIIFELSIKQAHESLEFIHSLNSQYLRIPHA